MDSATRKLYASWHNMKTRCLDPRHIAYARYGAVGITVCERWKSSFANFVADMGPKPTPKHTLERTDGKKGYEPSNCKWATPAEQARNRKNNVLITAWGETKHQLDWIADPRCTQHTPRVIQRELANGRPGEEALTFHGPHGKPSIPITAWGETKTVSEWLKDARCRANRKTLVLRAMYKVCPEQAISCGVGFRMVNDRGTIFLKRIAGL